MGVLNHQELMIVKGIGKTPGDTQSSELDPVLVNLLSTGVGYSLVDWSPNIPSLKSGGVWADNPINDGRLLVGAANTNVIETITVQLTGATCTALAANFAALRRLITDARAFWDSYYQIEPVYLRWWAHGAPAPQYALIFNIDMKVTYQDSTNTQIQLVLTIEREYGWRGVLPGGNPKQWYYHAIGQDSQWSATNANLLTGNDHTYVDTVNNRGELNAAVSGWLVKNYIDIPAAKIPGDLPALVNLSMSPTTLNSAQTTILIGKYTKPTTGNISRFSGNNQLIVHLMNAGDGTPVGADTTLVNDTGAPKAIGGGTAQRSSTTFATIATMSTRLQFWPGASVPNGFAENNLRGRYAVFCRTRVSAANTTCNLQLVFSHGADITLTPVVLTDQGAGGTGNTTDWAFLYLGQITIPPGKRAEVGSDGRGLWWDVSGVGEIGIKIQASRTAGAGSLYIGDVIFMPIDEGSVRIAASSAPNTAASWSYDNTGYYTHGGVDDYGSVRGTTEGDIPEISGSGITLTPGIINRLEFIEYVDSTKRSMPNDPTSITVRVDIVPRWSGIRDA